MTVILPLGAEEHIPEPWKMWDDEKSIGFLFPSVSGDEPHVITFHKIDRSLSCDCQGFTFNHGECRHCKLASASLYKKAKKRKKGVQDTSRESFHLLTPEDLSTRQGKVFEALYKHGPMSDKQIAAKLHWPINTVTPRRGELYGMGFIDDVGRQYDNITKRGERVWAIAR